MLKKYKERIVCLEDDVSKFNEFYFLLIDWMKIHYAHKSLVGYFVERNYKRVIVYGMKELGDCLVEELRNGEVEVVCGIDRDADYIIQNVPMRTPEQKILGADVIIVTAIHYYEQIKQSLSLKTDMPIISLKSIINEVMLEVFI